MYVQNLDVTDPDRLEAALDAAPIGTRARVVTAGETFHLTRVPGGWYLPGDVVITSGDVAGDWGEGQPREVSLLMDATDEQVSDALADDPREENR